MCVIIMIVVIVCNCLEHYNLHIYWRSVSKKVWF